MGKKAKKLRERRLAQQESSGAAEQQPEAHCPAAESLVLSHPAPALPVRGLQNLGNTCFFNSTMQALNATSALRPALARSICYFDDDSAVVSLALRSFLNSMASVCEAGDEAGQTLVRKKGKRSKGSGTRAGEDSSYCPGELLGAVRSAAGGSRFKGWEQQDAHELLLVVLGALEEEERKARGNTTRGASHSAPAGDEEKAQQADEAQADRIGECARATRELDTLDGAVSVFRGTLCSTVECAKCGNVTRRIEPFTDISLEIPLSEDEQKQLRAGKSKGKGGSADKGYAFGSKGKRARAKEKAKARDEAKEASCDDKGKGPKKLTGKKARREAKRLEKQQKDEARRRRQREHAEAHARAVAGITSVGDEDGDGCGDGGGNGGDGNTGNSNGSHGDNDGNEGGDGGGDEGDDACDRGGDGDGGDVENDGETGDNIEGNDGASNNGDEYPHGNVRDEATQHCTSAALRAEQPPAPPQMTTPESRPRNDCQRQQTPEGQILAPSPSLACKDERITEWHDIAGDGLESPPLEACEMERMAEGNAEANGALTIQACLRHFTRCEQLLVSEGNGFECPRCNKVTACTDVTDDAPRESDATAEGHTEERLGETDGCVGTDPFQSAPSPDARAQRTLSNATKRVLALQLPPVVVLHLKRLGVVRKISKHVTFPPDLDLGPFCMRQREQGDPVSASLHQQLYRLFAVVEHSGSKNGGHYVASVRRPSDDAANTSAGHWWFTSDGSTRPASESTVLKSQAYMLFYQRTDDH